MLATLPCTTIFCTFICCPSILHYSVYVRLGVLRFTYSVCPAGRNHPHPPPESGGIATQAVSSVESQKITQLKRAALSCRVLTMPVFCYISANVFVPLPTPFPFACFVPVVELLLFILRGHLPFLRCSHKKKILSLLNFCCFLTRGRLLPLETLVRNAYATAQVCGGICLWQGMLRLLSFVWHQHLCDSFSHYSPPFFPPCCKECGRYLHPLLHVIEPWY